MSYITQVDTSTLAAQNANTELLCHTFINSTRARKIWINTRVSGIVGNGTYKLRVTRQINGAGTIYKSVYASETVESGDTSHVFSPIPLIVGDATVGLADVIRVYLTGLGGDNVNAVGVTTDVCEEGNLTDTTATVVAAVSGTVVNVYRGTTWSINLIIGDLTGNTKVWFTLKRDAADPDSAAIVQIEKTTGLVVLNGSSVVTAGDGVLVVNNATTGDVTVTLKPASSSQIAPVSGINYDVRMLTATGVTEMADGRGKFSILPSVTQKIA
jgi:hypothetical protein